MIFLIMNALFHSRVRPAILSVAFTALLLTGCGGGGGGGTGTPTGGQDNPQEPESEEEVVLGLGGSGDADNIFPLSVGDYWHYRGLQDGSLSYHSSASVLETRGINGTVAHVLLETNSYNERIASESYFVSDPNGIANLGSDSLGDPALSTGDPFWELGFPLSVGDHFIQLDREGITTGEDIDGDTVHETYDIRSEVTVEAMENLSVPAGDFSDVYKLRRDVDMTVTLSSDSSTETIDATERTWYAPNVGPIKRVSTIGSGGSTETYTEELDVFIVGGVLSGITLLSSESVQSEIRSQEIDVYVYTVTPGQQYLTALGDLDGNVDLVPYLPDYCVMGSTNRPDNQDESCVVEAVDDRIVIAIRGVDESNYTLSVGAVPTIETPENEGTSEDPVEIQPGLPRLGQVGSRGTSYYSATGLSLGDYNVSITALSADADLHIYMDNTYSLELDCTLRAPGDTDDSPEDCTVNSVAEIYFSVTGGELNRDGATYLITVTGL